MAGASADELIAASHEVVRKLDEGRAGELWEQAPAFVKSSKSRDAFTQELQQGRDSVGEVQRRDWASVVRIRYTEGSTVPPAGLYANVDLAALRTDGKTVFELLSFRLEPQGWRLTGYVPRQNQ